MLRKLVPNIEGASDGNWDDAQVRNIAKALESSGLAELQWIFNTEAGDQIRQAVHPVQRHSTRTWQR